jgi:integrase
MPRKKLNDAVVRAARAKRGKLERLWDTVVENLVLFVRPNGRKTYWLYYRRNQKTRWFWLGRASAVSLQDARAKAKRLMAKIELDDTFDPQEARREARAAGTWEQLVDRYISESAKRRLKSWRAVEGQLKRHTQCWRGRPAGSIKRADVKQVFRQLSDTAPGSANLLLAHVSAVFDWAIKEEVLNLPANPAHGIERNTMKARERVVEPNELPRLWSTLAAGDDATSAALRLLLLTGQRPGEVGHMRWQDVRDRWWIMPGEPSGDGAWPGTKNKRTHMVYLSDTARALIDAQAGWHDTYVFVSSFGKPVDRLKERMQELTKRLELEPKVTPHDLRRTHATMITQLGWDRAAMDRVLGHKPGGVGSVYDRNTYADEFERIAVAVERELLRRVRGLRQVV